ncbi:hypothetical protein HPP92_011482 [Vanilla planifolia]|uniref:Uncharacterized protein n=1 Tax=Vanilla planifolia TaxID=51239 RepID=A0A835V3J4_VANPL|nr:hypothetical protein HPP92_011482 [Vanilla planifolia]
MEHTVTMVFTQVFGLVHETNAGALTLYGLACRDLLLKVWLVGLQPKEPKMSTVVRKDQYLGE